MKRIIIVAILALFLTVGTANAYYTVESGDTLYKIAYRAGMSLSAIINLNPQIANPDLIYPGDNINLDDGQFLVGAANPFRPSDVDIKIRQDLVSGSSRSGTTLNIDPIITPDNHRWTMTDIGNIAFGKIDPGTASNEEIISWTGMTDNTTYYTLTGVVWGYSYYDLSTSTANYKRHNSGARFIITDDDHFLNQQYVNKGYEQTISGQKTYSTYPKFSVTTTLPTLDSQFATKYYVDSVGAGGFTSLNVGTTRGLYALGTSPEKVGIATSTDSAYQGLYFDTSGKLGIKLNNSITSNADGLGVATTADMTWTGNHTFNGENIFNDQVTANATTTGFTLFGGQKALGDLTLTSGTTTFNTWATSTEWGNVTIDEGAALVFGSNFQNRVISMKVRGNLTLNGNIWAQGLGGLAGAQVAAETAGITGSEFPFMWTKMLATSTSAGSGGSTGGTTGHSGGAGGGGGSSFTQGTAGANGGGGGDDDGGGNAGRQVLGYDYYYLTINPSKYIAITAGAGGGSGGGGQDDNVGAAGVGGAGGNGGGMLIIEVSGNITFGADSVIHAGGNNGSAGGNYVAKNAAGGGGGGGGGAGGTIVILYNGTYTNSGVDLVVSGGAGGAGGIGDVSNNGGVGGNGGNGYSIIEKNYSF